MLELHGKFWNTEPSGSGGRRIARAISLVLVRNVLFRNPIATKVLIKILKISGETFEVCFSFTNLCSLIIVTRISKRSLGKLAHFHNLVHLEVTSEISFAKDKTMLNFLRISPNLGTIVIAK
ncbi:hypothetical protein MKX01_033016, partial [Papaver californicum]